mgnify:CR=1 FL=1|tara:strand:+ start:17 stop:358 length:342 start_codon:yes stop_codon:yes gene_type:complete
MQITPGMIVSIGAMLASVIASFVVVRTKVQQLEEELKASQTRIQKLDSRLDRNDNQTDLVSQKVGVLSGMMDPKTLEIRNREIERVIVQIKSIRSELDRLTHMHNGVHPPIKE